MNDVDHSSLKILTTEPPGRERPDQPALPLQLLGDVHSDDQSVAQLEQVLERAAGELAAVDPVDDLVEADVDPSVRQDGDVGRRVVRLGLGPLVQPIVLDGFSAMEPLVAIGPIDVLAEIPEKAVDIPGVVSIVRIDDDFFVGHLHITLRRMLLLIRTSPA